MTPKRGNGAHYISHAPHCAWVIRKTIYQHTVAKTCFTKQSLPGSLVIVEAKKKRWIKTKILFYFENEYKLQWPCSEQYLSLVWFSNLIMISDNEIENVVEQNLTYKVLSEPVRTFCQKYSTFLNWLATGFLPTYSLLIASLTFVRLVTIGRCAG